MRSFTFTEELESANSIVDLASRLGRICMEHGGELQEALDAPRHRQLSDAITAHVGALGVADWHRLMDDGGSLAGGLGDELSGLLEQAGPHCPLDCLAVLRGLCGGALAAFYEETEDVIPLGRGTPVPLASRPIAGGPELTPAHAAIDRDDLLAGYGHRLFEYSAGDHVNVVLDFSRRDRLDQVTWNDAERLPRIATIHPHVCGQLKVTTLQGKEFFDTTPAQWDLDDVLVLLRRVADVEIAVLPELSLPRPDALQAALSDQPESYPSLVVAGSAHLREKTSDGVEIRANETQIYLDGELVARYRKLNPYMATMLNGWRLPRPVHEALTREQKTITVLSSRHTRLAVVTCADLADEHNLQKLLGAGVNTLIAPCFSTKRGSLDAAIANLASRRQGVAVIANAPPENSVHPFHGMVAVPHPGSEGQSRIYPDAPEEATEIAVFDPNQSLHEAITWR